jgi:antitoxin (DNA-binding transcriptional repressor) of toxin-antitoxin stability system
MTVAHISEEEAVRDVAGLLARVRAGEEIVIEGDNVPNVVVSPIDEHSVRPHPKLTPLHEARSKTPGFDWETLKRDRDEGRP